MSEIQFDNNADRSAYISLLHSDLIKDFDLYDQHDMDEEEWLTYLTDLRRLF